MPFTQHNGVRLFWDARGPEAQGVENASTIVLVMGHRYSSAMWYPVIPELAKRHRVVWFDNRGTGESGWSRHTSIGEMAGDALAVMDAAGVQKAHVFGVSMGGVIVQEMFRQQKQRIISLIVGCSGILSAEKPRAPRFLLALYYLPPSLLKILMPRRRSDKGYGSAATRAAIDADIAVLERDKHVVAGVVAQAAAIAAYTISKEEVAGFNVPTLVMHGDEDSTVPFSYSEELVATLPNSRLVRLEGAGHNFFVAGKQKTLAELTAFLDGADRATAAPT